MDTPRVSAEPTVPIEDAGDLANVYTPGVAETCRTVADDPGRARDLTTRGTSVAVVGDGSAVLGLGDVGPLAALPVLEGKAALYKRFGGVDAWPLCVSVRDESAVVDAVATVTCGFGGVSLEDIAAPRCFTIERALADRLDVPVFHDDQHGTAIVVLGALRGALRLVDKDLEDVRIVISGAGAAGVAIARLLGHVGAERVAVYDSRGSVHPDRDDLDDSKAALARSTTPDPPGTGLADGLRGADVFIGVSAPGLLGGEDVAAMAGRPIVFALANPDPEIDPEAAREHAAVVATGRSDEPNQINNVLAFPGVFRGLLDVRARAFTMDAEAAAAGAIADVAADRLDRDHVVPSVFDHRLAPALARAVAGTVAGTVAGNA